MTSGGANYYYHADGLGSVTKITDVTGNLVESYRYDVFGTPTMYDHSAIRISQSAIGNRLLFTGRDYDPDTGWYNYRHRYYNPALGRFVQPDPIGLAGEDIHLYRYSLNSPTCWTDPTGLAVLQVTRQDGSIQTYYRPTSATIQQVLQQATNSGNLIDSMRIKGHGATELIMLDGNDFLIVDNMGRITDQVGKDLTDMFSKGVAQSGAIDLAGCQTGRGKDNIAKRMSNTLPNRVISGGKGLYQLGIPFMANAIGKKNFYMDGNLVHSQWTK
jgi:RHS repeat-associated protein